MYAKQHLSNIWSSIHENVKQYWGWAEKKQAAAVRGVFTKTCSEKSSKFTGEHTCRSVISIKLLCSFIEIALRHGCKPVNLQHIFKTHLDGCFWKALLIKKALCSLNPNFMQRIRKKAMDQSPILENSVTDGLTDGKGWIDPLAESIVQLQILWFYDSNSTCTPTFSKTQIIYIRYF